MVVFNKVQKPLSAVAIAVAIYSFSPAHAEESFTVSGPLTYFYSYDYLSGTNSYIYDGSFTATVTHNPSVPSQYNEYEHAGYYKVGYTTWNDAVTSIEYEVLDANGSLIMADSTVSSNYDYTYGYAQTYAVDYDTSYYYSDFKQELFVLNQHSYSSTYEESYNHVYSYDYTNDSVITGSQAYPDLSDNLDWDYNEFYSYLYNSNIYQYVAGNFNTVGGGNIDTDGDGVLDRDDACIESDRTAKVIVGTDNTGVTNKLLTNGCTITDMIKQIQLAEVKHGHIVSGVAHFLNAITNDGTITGRDKGKIQSAVAKSNPKGNGK